MIEDPRCPACRGSGPVPPAQAAPRPRCARCGRVVSPVLAARVIEFRMPTLRDWLDRQHENARLASLGQLDGRVARTVHDRAEKFRRAIAALRTGSYARAIAELPLGDRAAAQSLADVELAHRAAQRRARLEQRAVRALLA